MDKPQKKNEIKRGLPSGINFLGGVSMVALFGLAIAIFAATAAQAGALLPPLQGPPSTKVTLPEFTVTPRLPHVEMASDEVADEQLNTPADWFRGVASWYGPSFNGRLTANGEVYDMYSMTAATTEFHPKLPLGTRVRVVNSNNGRSVVVRITDRGPLPKGRIIDLSYGAARKLGMVKHGIARVRVHVLRWGHDDYHHAATSGSREAAN